MDSTRTRWAAIGAAVAITLGAGGIGITHATSDGGDGPVSAFFPIEPCRLVENAAVTADSSITLNGWGETGDCDLPNGITGLAANVTAVNATQQTNLRFYANGDAVPETANLNPSPGAAPTPNAVNITLNTSNGQFRVYNRFGSVGVFIDVMGYYDDHTHDDRYYTETETDALVRSRAASGGFTGGLPIGTADEEVTSVTIETPSAGQVIVDVTFYAFSIENADRQSLCSITTGTAYDPDVAMASSVKDDDTDAIAITRGFAVTGSPSSRTYRLICRSFVGSYQIGNPAITAIFVPDGAG